MPRVDKPKDPNAPKRPQSGYFLYSNSRRAEFKKQKSDKKLTEISKIVAKEWKEITNDAKKKREEQAKELKLKYNETLEKYKKSPEYKKYLADIAKWKQESKNKAVEVSDDENDEDDDDDNNNKKSSKGVKPPKKTKRWKCTKTFTFRILFISKWTSWSNS